MGTGVKKTLCEADLPIYAFSTPTETFEMHHPKEDSTPTASNKRGPWWLAYAAIAALALVFIVAFLGVDGQDVNSRFLFNNPLREIIVTTALAMFGFMGCMMVWNRRGVLTKYNPTASEIAFYTLLVVFLLTQMPFLKVQTKLEVLVSENNVLATAVKAVEKVADDPANGISDEVRKKLMKEIYREGLISTGDLMLHKGIK